MALAFNIPTDKDAVRRILAHHYQPEQDSGGPSWLTFVRHMKDSLWIMDLFRCESATLRTHWVLVVMDQYTRRIIGFGVRVGAVDGAAMCRMFNHAIRRQLWMPKYLITGPLAESSPLKIKDSAVKNLASHSPAASTPPLPGPSAHCDQLPHEG